MTDSALGLLGVDLDTVYASAGDLPIEQGVEAETRNGRAILAVAVSNQATGSLVVIQLASAEASASVQAVLASTGNCTTGRLAVAQTSVNSGQYAWYHTEINKEGRILGANACAPNVQLYVTTTGGVVDDATVSVGQIQGLFVKATASAGNTLLPCVAANLGIVQNAGVN
jgi:hypothetical protein